MKKTSIAALIAAALAVLVIFGLLVFRMVTTMSSRAPDDVDTAPGLVESSLLSIPDPFALSHSHSYPPIGICTFGALLLQALLPTTYL